MLLVGVACPTAEAEPEPEPYVQPAPWEDLGLQQREDFMTWVFNPAMHTLFTDRDPDLYADFGCETCHGEDPEDIDYEMPANVSALTIDDVPVDGIDDPERLEQATWMEEAILPAMADMFEQEMTLAGSSCLDCHPFE
jgi:hypothetical protein